MTDIIFDELSARFGERIYAGLKGQIRLAVLQADIHQLLLDKNPAKKLQILDVGAGLGQMSIWLSQQGHHVTLIEPSKSMLAMAQSGFTEANQTAKCHQTTWQDYESSQKYDLILCHAVIEWIEDSQALLHKISGWIKPQGMISLAYYNRDALIYRNLLKGHFKKIERGLFRGDHGSLTPSNPIDPKSLKLQIPSSWQSILTSGIRCFYDFMPHHFQQKAKPEEIIAMELAYRHREPFCQLGRYLHQLYIKDA